MRHATHLSWKMVVQRPPMTFDTTVPPNKMMDPRLQEPAYNSGEPKTNPISFFVLPTMMHGSNLMVRGTVFCGKGRK